MNFLNARNLIRKGEISPVNYFYGREKILAEILTEEITKKKIPSEEIPSSVYKFDLAESGWENITNLLSTPSIFSTTKLVIVKTDSKVENRIPKDIDQLKDYLSSPTQLEKRIKQLNVNLSKKEISSYPQLIKKVRDLIFELSQLKNYLISPSPHSILVVIAEKEESELLKIFKDFPSCFILKLSPLSEFELEIIIEEIFRENGKIISPSAMKILVEEAQEDLSLALNDIKKILLYTLDKKEIEREDIEKLSSFTKTYKIDHLLRAMEERNEAKAFDMLEELLEIFEPVLFLAVVSKRFCNRYYFLLREYEKRINGKIPWNRDYSNEIRKLEATLKTIFETDIKIKTHPFNKGILEELICRIMKNERLLGNKEI